MSSRRGVNMNAIAPRSSTGFDWSAQNRGADAGAVTVHFGDVASAAEEFITGSPMLVGAVAWVKSRRLISALAARPVALVVNKEFGLRVQGHPEREALMPLQGGVPTAAFPPPIPRSSHLEPVRCAGFAAKGRFGALMHHKFLVRLDVTGAPVAVWTGSFNLTAGAESNIENGMTIHDPVIAQAFLAEFCRVWALSEPLVFSSGAPTPGSQANGVARIPAPKRTRTVRKKAVARKPTAKKTATKAGTKTAAKTAAKKATAAAKAPVKRATAAKPTPPTKKKTASKKGTR